jgi:hypothetical protein
MNPAAPNIRGLPKVYKVGCPIRAVINWQGAPAYKLAKYLNKLIHLYIPLPNAFNIKNSVYLIDDLLEIPNKQRIRLVSFGIENMYPKIPSNELIRHRENVVRKSTG